MIVSGTEYLDLEILRRIQKDNWALQAKYVVENSAFYHGFFGSLKLTGHLEQISELPFTDKEMLRKDQHQNPPFGSYLAASEHSVVRMHRTSGTTGTAMNLALTQQDANMTATVGARAQSASGLGPGHRVVHCLNYQLWMGGYTDHSTLEATGAMVVPFGVGSSDQLIRLIQDLKINAISCTPSYPAVLEQVIKKSFTTLSPRDLGLQLGLFGGEAGLDDPAFRHRLEQTWGFKVRNANYGVTDVLCNFAGQTRDNNDLHFMALDVLYPELIDPGTGTGKPWRAGESGELVLTHLCKEAQPLVRFRTGDIILVTDVEKSTCGRTAPRFRVIGRSDDMVVVRGINVFPTMIAAVIHQISGLSGEYRVTLSKAPPHDYLPVEVELSHPVENSDSLIGAIESEVKRQIGVTAKIKLLEPNALPRTAGKSKRVIREY